MKVGDKVRIKNCSGSSFEGLEGEIEFIEGDWVHLMIKFGPYAGILYFKSEDLEIVTRKREPGIMETFYGYRFGPEKTSYN